MAGGLAALPPSLLPALPTDAALPAWAVLLAVAATGLALLLAERRFLSPRRLLTPEDVAASPGRPVRLRAWVERDLFPLWDPPLAGAEVRFTVDGVVRAATTDVEGKAELAIDPPAPGLHVVRVETDQAAANELLVEVSDKP